MAGIQAVIFDLGRVLLSLDPFRPKFSALMQAVGVRPEEAFSKYWKDPDVVRHMVGRMTAEDFHAALRARFGLDMAYADFADAWCDLFEPIAGMEDIFRTVRERLSVGILSDTDSLHWRRAGELLPWLADVERPTLSFKTGFLKPAPEMYAFAARNVGRAPGACLFIDDLPRNILGAEDAGMTGIVFDGVENLRRKLDEFGIL